MVHKLIRILIVGLIGTVIASKFTSYSVSGGKGSAMYATDVFDCDFASDEAVDINSILGFFI